METSLHLPTPVSPVFESGHSETLRPSEGGSLGHRLKSTSFLLARGDFRTLLPLVWETAFGAADMVLLRLDLDSFRSEHLSRYALTARPLERPEDAPEFFDLNAPGLSGQDRRDTAARLFMLRAGIQTCYVVENASGKPCFLQWLIPYSENDKLHSVYGKWYPDLQPGEALAEHAIVLPEYRGNGLMPCAVAKVFEIARQTGVQNLVTFIPTWNSNSLRSFTRLGFTPYLRRSDRKFFGFCLRRHLPISPPERVSQLQRAGTLDFAV